MNAAEVSEVVTYLSRAFPNFRPDLPTVAVWANELEDYDARDVREATRLICQGMDPESSPNFPPTTAAVCAAARICGRERGDREESARRATQQALEARVESTLSEAARSGASIRERLARGERLSAIIDGVGRPIPGPPVTDHAMNEARRKALDAFDPASQKPPPARPDPETGVGAGEGVKAAVRGAGGVTKAEGRRA